MKLNFSQISTLRLNFPEFDNSMAREITKKKICLKKENNKKLKF